MRVEVVAEMDSLDPHALRSLEAMRHAPTLLTLHDDDGNVLLRNPAALQRLGADGALGDHWLDRVARERLLADVQRDGRAETEIAVATNRGEGCHRVGASYARDPVTGAWVIVTAEYDVTESQVLNESLATTNELLTTLLHSIPVAVLVEDEHRRIRQTNHAFCRLFDLPVGPAALVDADCDELLEQARHAFRDPEAFARRVREILAAREPVEAEEWVLADGRVLERSYQPVFVGTRYRGHLWQYTDVTEQRRTETALREQAAQDWLTGLTNQRAMREYLAQVHADVVRSRATAAVLMVDIDRFKPINDTFGHAAGDQVLIEVVRAVESALRRSDRLGRIGGEEFLAVLPDTDLAGARETAARVQRAPRERGCVRPDGTAVTVSVGFTLMTAEDASPLDAGNRADAALYAAKRGGRDRVSERLD